MQKLRLEDHNFQGWGKGRNQKKKTEKGQGEVKMKKENLEPVASQSQER